MRLGLQVTDLHRHFIDKLTIPDAAGTGVLRRVDEVFDCWFESGSMPYAQVHYPFEQKQAFEEQFPADFVAEGVPTWPQPSSCGMLALEHSMYAGRLAWSRFIRCSGRDDHLQPDCTGVISRIGHRAIHLAEHENNL